MLRLLQKARYFPVISSRALSSVARPTKLIVSKSSSTTRSIPSISTKYGLKQVKYNTNGIRWYATSAPYKVLKREELDTIIKGDPDSYTLIDVREVGELEYGQIPTSHNIPRMYL
jgi:hypothetical protein